MTLSSKGLSVDDDSKTYRFDGSLRGGVQTGVMEAIGQRSASAAAKTGNAEPPAGT